MTVYSADIAVLESLIDTAARTSADIETRIATIEHQIADLHFGWQGESAQHHRENADLWQRSMSEMRAALTGLRSAVDGARTTYLANVDHNRRMWP